MMSIAIYPVEIIQTPKQVTIISEAFSEVRRVYLDRPQWKIEDVAPGYYGRSVGHWDGDTLVVDTVGIKPAAAGYRGMPHSAQMRVTDRIRMLSPEMLDYEMVEFVCDNNREYVDEKGIVRLKLHDK